MKKLRELFYSIKKRGNLHAEKCLLLFLMNEGVNAWMRKILKFQPFFQEKLPGRPAGALFWYMRRIQYQYTMDRALAKIWFIHERFIHDIYTHAKREHLQWCKEGRTECTLRRSPTTNELVTPIDSDAQFFKICALVRKWTGTALGNFKISWFGSDPSPNLLWIQVLGYLGFKVQTSADVVAIRDDVTWP